VRSAERVKAQREARAEREQRERDQKEQRLAAKLAALEQKAAARAASQRQAVMTQQSRAGLQPAAACFVPSVMATAFVPSAAATAFVPTFGGGVPSFAAEPRLEPPQGGMPAAFGGTSRLAQWSAAEPSEPSLVDFYTSRREDCSMLQYYC
jgi:hypothetical protein